jgi:hypothetical protein
MVGYLYLVLGIGAGAALGWWWLKAHPSGRCRWCRGSRRNRFSTKWRYGDCKHCGGTGQREWKV